MGTCKECKWWGALFDWRGHHFCDCPKIAEDLHGDDEMSYMYDEGGAMTTGKDFGCIHFTQMEKK